MVKSENSRVSIIKAFPIFLAFLCMGFGDVVGPITGIVKEDFNLSNFEAFLIPLNGIYYVWHIINSNGNLSG